MVRNFLVLFLFIQHLMATGTGTNPVILSNPDSIISISPSIDILNDPHEKLSIHDLRNFRKNVPSRVSGISEQGNNASVQWVLFTIKNTDTSAHTLRISVAFTDFVELHYYIDSASGLSMTGDLLDIPEREIPLGQICFVRLTIPSGKEASCYLKLKSTSNISRQFRSIALRSIRGYPAKRFREQFIDSRLYQSFFYGAVIVMLIYNFFIFISLRSITYLLYVNFLFSLLLFFSSNNGYLVELILPHHPRADLYIRFISAPLTLLSFLLFSRAYLKSSNFFPKLDKYLQLLIVLFVMLPLLMISGSWKLGRSVSIIAALGGFIFISYLTIITLKKKYEPARYFFIANILLIMGGLLFAFERLNILPSNLLTQYLVQGSILLQITFFSIGLADRMRLTQKELSETKLQNQKLETMREIERKKIIEEKNKELERSNIELDTFIYKTAHDIKGPLARVLGLSNVGLMDVQDPTGREYLKRLQVDATYLNYILKRLSIVHEIKNLHPKKELIDFNKLVDEVVSELRRREDFEYADIVTSLAIHTPVYSDKNILHFILLNLLENGLKFRKEGMAHKAGVHLKAISDNDRMTITVSDNGIGIMEEEIPYLFEMFSRAAGKYKSPGLGLYMVKHSIEKLKGNIVLTSNAQPTIFTIEIPSHH